MPRIDVSKAEKQKILTLWNKDPGKTTACLKRILKD